ncbi:MAG: hypothetical protein IIZ11_00200 [Erysipelotrichaceae bacterium]|nr:hypothetical protein [Erysipelotrichaceae bacterium]
MALQEYKCPNCGGALQFDSASKKVKCPYCGTEFEAEVFDSLDSELDIENTEDKLDWQKNNEVYTTEDEDASLRIFVCESCGGEIITDADTVATSCPYCGNPVVDKGNVKGMLKPDLIIPFKLDKKAAKDKYEQHLQGKKLLPPIFKDKNHIDEIKGVYVPYWVYDVDANANYNFRATTSHTWSDSSYYYTETSYYNVYRSGNISFNAIPVDASTKIADDLTESLEPYDMKDAIPFKTAYLAGYMADRYNIDYEESEKRADERLIRSAEQAFASTVRGYETVSKTAGNVSITDGIARYVLLPIWILNTTWNGQHYTFAMNGQTGKFVGDLPIDNGQSIKYFLLYTLIPAIIITAVLALVMK